MCEKHNGCILIWISDEIKIIRLCLYRYMPNINLRNLPQLKKVYNSVSLIENLPLPNIGDY